MIQSDLPEIVQELIDLIGIGETIELMRAFGGSDVKFPRTERVGNLNKFLKPDSIKKIVAHFQGSREYIPNLRRTLARTRAIRIHELHEAGYNNYEIARQMQVSRRWVQRVLQTTKPKADEVTQQLPLF